MVQPDIFNEKLLLVADRIELLRKALQKHVDVLRAFQLFEELRFVEVVDVVLGAR